MSASKRRNKIISLRLNHEEYLELMSVCRVRGARSISDFARVAMQKLGEGALLPPRDLDAVIEDLELKLNSMANQLAILKRLIKGDNC